MVKQSKLGDSLLLDSVIKMDDDSIAKIDNNILNEDVSITQSYDKKVKDDTNYLKKQ